jgi:hypothetical protein
MKLLSIVIPCFNEVEGLSHLFDRLDILVERLSLNKIKSEVILSILQALQEFVEVLGAIASEKRATISGLNISTLLQIEKF